MVVVTSVADSESQAAQKDGYRWLLAVTGGYWRLLAYLGRFGEPGGPEGEGRLLGEHDARRR